MKPLPGHPRRRLAVVLVLIATMSGATWFVTYEGDRQSTNDAYVWGNIVRISPQVAAPVAAIHIDDNKRVARGELLVELDPTDYEVALRQARGAEASAKGKLAQARAAVESAKSAVADATAGLEAARAMFENAVFTFKRLRDMSDDVRAPQEMDDATARQRATAASVQQAQAKLQVAQSRVVSANASVIAAEGDFEKAQADTRRAEVNLGYCRIIAPSAGRITNRNVNPGDYVTPGIPLFQIVPSETWVVANFKEVQLTHMHPGQPAEIRVDAFPDLRLSARVESLQAGTGSRFQLLPPENATGNWVKVVQRVPVKLILDAARPGVERLAQGMSVEAIVDTSRKTYSPPAIRSASIAVVDARR